VIIERFNVTVPGKFRLIRQLQFNRNPALTVCFQLLCTGQRIELQQRVLIQVGIDVIGSTETMVVIKVAAAATPLT